MDTLSVWRGTAAPVGFAPLQGDVRCDVLIVGGGITGVTLALLLGRQGRKVVLLEAAQIGSGATGNSTGNLYETLSLGLDAVRTRWGEDVACQVVAERATGIRFIEEHSRELPEAGFRRCPLVLWAQTAEGAEQVDHEARILARAGCRVERSEPPPVRPAMGEALILHDQAQFHPQAYVSLLARQASAAGASLHEHSPVIELDTRARRAVTPSGAVDAAEIVLATHTPKGVRLVHAQMPVHREYGIALEMQSFDPGPGIYWWQGDEGLSFRSLEVGGRRYVVCVGQEHETGHHNARASLMALENLAARQFGPAPVAFRWSAQNYRGADHLPYIGRDGSGCFVATGFSTDGLTWGTVAAHIIVAQLDGHPHAFGELCKPTRLSPIKGAKAIVQENLTTLKSLVQDYLTHRQGEKLTSLAPGDSAIIESEGDALAAWRSPEGELFAVSPVCTHMGCKVHWNSVETSWDCPCHGSRFRPDGTVIEGPALAPLRRKHLPDVRP